MKGKIVLAGIIGAAVGAVASYFFTRRYYEGIIYDETKIGISEETEDKPEANEETTPIDSTVPEIIAYANEVAKKRERKDYSKAVADTVDDVYLKDKSSMHPSIMKEVELGVKPLQKKSDAIRSIPYIEYGDNEDYEEKVLYLYADGIIADEDDEILEEVEQTLGPNPKEHIDEFDTGDMCYFVNDNQEMYYELYLSEKSYYGDVVDDDE